MTTRSPPTLPGHMRGIGFFAALVFLAILLVLGKLVHILVVEDREIQALNAARAKAFEPARQALLAYRRDRGRFPEGLDELVPSYLPAVPPVLARHDSPDPVMDIRYERLGDSARFVYRTSHGPDSRAVFDVASGRTLLDP